MTTDENTDILNALREMRKNIISLSEAVSPDLLDPVLRENRMQALSLIQYMAFRKGDYRQVQDQLTEKGLSSLRACESHSLHSVNQVIGWLDPSDILPSVKALDMKKATALQKERKCALFKAEHLCPDRFIMVTLDAGTNQTESYYANLIHAGMNCARINTGHDGPEDWKRTIKSIRKASESIGKDCAVYLDLSGPKIRISKIVKKKGKQAKKISLSTGMRIAIAGPGFVDSTAGLPALHLSIPKVIERVQVGQKILFDDGVIRADTVEKYPAYIVVEIQRTKGEERKIKLENGIAFPGLELNIPAITEEDKIALVEMAALIDIVGLSFIHHPKDIKDLRKFIESEGWSHLGVVAKIETLSAFNELPHILLALLELPRHGVMIARGDLALEVGMERMAEVQEEILWLCEAAMVPVIWATQVLESLTKLGIPTRAEISDAAMSVQAECVMLNKGPYIFDSVSSLAGILNKMGAHHNKKTSQMRRLELADRFFNSQKTAETTS